MTDNPLLQEFNLPNHVPPFDKIDEEHYLPAIRAAIEEGRGNIEKIKNETAAPDFENTIEALESATETLDQVTSVFYNQLSVAGTDNMHELAEQIGPVCSSFSNDVMHDAALFERVKTVHDRKETLGLTPEQTMLLDESYKSFVRGGALLGEEDKNRLREISERMSVLAPSFMNNVTKATEAFELVIDRKDDLSGLPESIIESAKNAAEEKGYDEKWLFTLDAPSFFPFIKYADNRDLREKIWRAFTSRAWQDDFDNSGIILEIIRLRYETANLLGYKTFADFVLEKRMAERAETVTEFLNELKALYKPAASKDLALIQEYARQNNGPDPVKPWDTAYYIEKVREEKFAFSEEDLRPYFHLENVLDGAFTHFSKLFHLQFKKNEKYPVWHKDVVAYDVTDLTDGRFVGTLYGDFFPRKGKKGGAWKTSYRDQGLYHGKLESPVVSIVCNFTKPSGDKPSLLTHDEVLTLFHELGHAIHALLSKVTYQSLAGTSVLWDFVELPSQIQENWAYTKETLDLFARHYETGETIPETLVQKLNETKNFMAGWTGLRQLNFSILDMAWHSQDPADIEDVAAFEDAATAETSLFPRLSGPFSNAFAHIFAGGYAAGYYSYKWAEVLDADAFELFNERGLYDQSTAEAFKNEILSKGGSEHPRILYRRFRGRDADPKALLRREGLINGKQKAA